MSEVTWGLLAKSLEDPETIEEAIDRIVAAHNDDESAHLEAGQSLQSHKASEIIDHAVASIVADKISGTEGLIFHSFESLDNYQKSGAGIYNSIGFHPGGCDIIHEYGLITFNF